jgi:hypothetical protein
MRTSALLLLVGAFLATQPGASCVSDTSSGDPTPRTPIDTDNPNEIPRRASIVKEGRGTLEYSVDADGDLYVQDLKDEVTVVAHRVHRGDKISVLPDDNRVRLDDDSIYKGNLKKDHVHRIYLLRDRRFDDRDNRNNDNRKNDDRNDSKNDDRRDNNLTGVQINTKDRGPNNERGVPKDARMMDQGKGREMTFVTSVPGKVYIFDVEHDRVVATPEIDARQVFKFSPGIDRVMIDGKRAGNYDFDPNSQYRIYFAR